MAGDYKVGVQVSAKDDASAVFEKIGNSAQTMGEAIEKAGETGGAGLQTLSQQIKASEGEIRTVGTAMVAAGAAGTAAFGLAANKSIDFSAAMANVNSIARLSNGEMSSLQATILGLATQFGSVPTDLADALYDIVGSGFEASEAVDILTASTIAAGAGLTNTATATKAITAVLNAYRMGADKAGDVSDVLFKTVDSGVISFEELSGSMGRVLPLASSLQVSIEELGAAYATLTLQGIGASEAETGISAVLTAAISPTEALTAAVKEYGYESAEALIAAEGFAGFLTFLQTAAGGSTAVMSELTGNVRATNAALALGADNGQLYTGMLGDMNGAVQDGAYTLEVFGIQMDNAAGSLRQLGAEASAAAINIGAGLEPLIQFAAEAGSSVLHVFNSLPGPIQQSIGVLGALASVSTLAAGSLLILLPKIVETRAALMALGGARGVLALLAGTAINPLTVGVAGLALASAGLYTIFQNVEASASGVAEGVGLLADEVERLKLAAQPELAEQVQTIVDSIRTQTELLSGDMSDLVANGIVPEGTDFLAISGPGGLADQVKTAGQLVDDLSEHIITTLNTIPDQTGKQAYLDWINGLMADIQYGVEGTNLDDIINEVLITPASEVPGVMDAITDATDGATGATKELTAAQAALAVVTGAATDGLNEMAAAQALVAGMQERSIAGLDATTAHMADLTAGYVENLNALMDVAGVGDPLSQWNLSGHATEMSLLADAAGDAATSLDSAFRVIVGNTNAIGSQIQGLDDWATKLIGVQGEYAKIDDLLAEGRISLDQYNAAQQAQTTIMGVNAEVQRDILSIQAMQAPLLADLTEKQGAYIDQIAGLPAQQQLVALGWMDATEAGRAMEFQTLAIAAASGELGKNGEQAFISMITGAATADPVLKGLLVDMGLISEGADGTVTVNLDGVEGAMSDMDRLTQVMVSFMDLFDDGVLNQSITLETLGLEDVESARDAVDQLPDNKAVNVSFNIEQPGGFSDLLGNYFDNVLGRDEVPAVTIPTDLTLSDGAIAALQDGIEPITIPVNLNLGSMGEGTADSAVGLAQSALQEARNGLSYKVRVEADTTQAEADISALGSAIEATDVVIGVNVEGGALSIGLLTAIGNSATDLAALSPIDIAISDTGGTHGIAAGNLDSLAEKAGTLAGLFPIDLAVTDTGGTHGIAAGNLDSLIGRASSLSAIDPDIAVSVSGAALAIGQLHAVANAALSIPGSVSTTVTTNLVTNRYENLVRSGFTARLGGIPELARGGVLFEGGEAGREMAYFAGGGMAELPVHGLYSAPPHTYISPANANPGSGERPIIVDFSGSTFNGTSRSDMDAWAEQSLIPNLRKVIQDERAGQVS